MKLLNPARGFDERSWVLSSKSTKKFRNRGSPLQAAQSSGSAHANDGEARQHPEAGMSNRRLQETPSTVEMYVASTDELLQEPGSESGPGLKRSQTMQVPPPRHAPPRKLNLAADGELTSSSESHGEGKLRAAQNELGMVAAELRDTVIELKESQQNLRAREGEVILLRAALAGRDINLRNSKAELMSSESSLREKDIELQELYQQLMSNAEESGDVRKQLLDTQAELAEARADLELWTQNAGSADSDNHTKKLGKQNTKSMVDISGQGNSDDAPPDVTKLMQNLSQLSDQLAKDALADEGV